jgi:branched-chain amino acid transport system substrate-binding protein
MKKSIKISLFIAMSLGLLLIMSCGRSEENEIKVGFVDCYSGPPSVYTNDVRDAFKMEIDKVNAKGGVLGRKVVFTTRDSKFKVDLGLSAAKELILKEEVDILMGTINSAVSLAISSLVEKEKVPFIVTFAKSSNITGAKGHRYVFCVSENTVMAGKSMAEGLNKLGYTKYWIAGSDYEYGHTLASDTWKKLKKLKPSVEQLGESWWKVGEPDLNPYITAMIAAKPDAIIIAAGGADTVPFLKAAKATGLSEKIPFVMHTATELSTLNPLGLNAPEGVLGTSNYHYFYPETSENKTFAEEFKSTYKRPPAVGAFYGYMAANFMVKAFEKAGTVDKEKFIDAMEELTIGTPVGDVTMRAFDHQAMLPMFMGVTKKAEGYNHLIADKIITLPGSDIIPTFEEVKKAREK